MLKTICPISMTFNYSLGSFLLMVLLFQIMSGIVLTLFFSVMESFVSVDSFSLFSLVIVRWFHVLGASVFFLFLYMHMFRGLFYSSYMKTHVWTSGVTIFIFSMLSAFLGYTLPWGQMSFWATTVITSFLSVIPYFGDLILKWILGSFIPAISVLKFFFCLHFLFPFMILMLVIIHMVLLHTYGSTNVNSKSTSMSFFYYILKDILNLFLFLFLFFFFKVWNTFESLNFVAADPVVSPLHIKPEWYFLFLYAILRSVPHKLTGVLLMLFSLLVMYMLPLSNKMYMTNMNYYILFWFILIFSLLTWIGAKPILDELNLAAVLLTGFYFKVMVLLCFSFK